MSNNMNACDKGIMSFQVKIGLEKQIQCINTTTLGDLNAFNPSLTTKLRQHIGL